LYASPIENMNCRRANRYQAQAASGLLRGFAPQDVAAEQDRPDARHDDPLPAIGGNECVEHCRPAREMPDTHPQRRGGVAGGDAVKAARSWAAGTV